MPYEGLRTHASAYAIFAARANLSYVRRAKASCRREGSLEEHRRYLTLGEPAGEPAQVAVDMLAKYAQERTQAAYIVGMMTSLPEGCKVKEECRDKYLEMFLMSAKGNVCQGRRAPRATSAKLLVMIRQRAPRATSAKCKRQPMKLWHKAAILARKTPTTFYPQFTRGAARVVIKWHIYLRVNWTGQINK